jgi:CHRD domain
MKLRFAILCVCALAAGCDDNPSAPTTGAQSVFVAQLFPANENPAIVGAESGGHGAAQIAMTVTRDSSGAVTGGTASMTFQLAGFNADTRIIGAHIHRGAAGVNGPVIVNTGLSGVNTFALTDGMGQYTAADVAVDAATMQSILENPAGWYFNVHSPLNPGGFARGQLTRIR